MIILCLFLKGVIVHVFRKIFTQPSKLTRDTRWTTWLYGWACLSCIDQSWVRTQSKSPLFPWSRHL